MNNLETNKTRFQFSLGTFFLIVTSFVLGMFCQKLMYESKYRSLQIEIGQALARTNELRRVLIKQIDEVYAKERALDELVSRQSD